MARLIPRLSKDSQERSGRYAQAPREVLSDHTDAATTHPENGQVGERWTGGAWIVSKLVTAGLWVLIASGPIALVVALGATSAQQPATPAAAPQPDLDALEEQAASGRAAAEFAQSFVVTWLSTPLGEEGRLAEYGVDTSGIRLPKETAELSNAAVAAFSESSDDVWTVRVGVDVVWPASTDDDAVQDETSTDDDAAAQDGVHEGTLQNEHPTPQRQYFQVTVDGSGGALAVQTLPAAVPHETTTPAPRLAYRDRLGPGDEAFDTAAGFLSALLAGDGDLTRYTIPDPEQQANLVPVTPPPYTAVDTSDVRVDQAAEPTTDGASVNVLVTATAETAGGQEIPVQYPLVMTARDGRWEVAEISPAALTHPQSPTDQDATS
jgi:hypothetical protein